VRLELHADAARNFNAKAEELVTKIIPDPYANRPRPKSSFTPDIVIHDQPQGVQIISTGYVSPLGGKEIAKTFWDGSKTLGLFEEGYKDLVRLAERMQKTKSIRDRVSTRLLIDLIFKWVAAKYQQAGDVAMTEYVLTECEKELRELEIWIPVAMLQIQSDIMIGKVTLRTITKELLDPWLAAIAASAINSTAPQVEQRLDEMRREMQGFAAATVRLFAEPLRTSEIAFEEAERAVALLRFFSPASRIPELVSYCTLRGREHMEAAKQLTVQDEMIVGYSDQSIDHSSPFWTLDDEYIGDVKGSGLGILSDLLNSEKLTEYQEALLDSVLLYSKAALAKDPAAKLIAILVALESFLLKDSNEPIQQNLAERMAFLFKVPASERREKKRQVIRAYGLRSSFIHHGHSIDTDEMDTLREFMMTAWMSFIILIEVSNTYTTKAQLFDKLEELKMS
jgi:Apea-like HEPN